MSPFRADLLVALGMIQNHPACVNQDIMTITGCGMTDNEVLQHIEANMARVARWSEAPVKAKAKAKRSRKKK